MGLLRLLNTGAAVAAAVNYVTKKRPDGTSIADDLKAKAPDLMNKARPYADKVKEQWANMNGKKNTEQSTDPYPEKYNNFSPDPNPAYSS